MNKPAFSLPRIWFYLPLSVFLSAPALADTPPAVVAASSTDVTRIEFVIVGYPVLPRPDELPKKITPDTDPNEKAREKGIENVVLKATRILTGLSAQFPKCQFHIASMVPPEDPSKTAGLGATPNNPDLIPMRVTILGEPRCLAAK